MPTPQNNSPKGEKKCKHEFMQEETFGGFIIKVCKSCDKIKKYE